MATVEIHPQKISGRWKSGVARRQQMDGLYVVDAAQTQGKRILLFDDLFRSGSTMNAITEALLGPGQATIVYALTITKTRSNQ
ncbi:MAG: hypothetical protein JNM40_13515 [Myxococcales bacterium]|nr:hypothetical protein [Myxococcales bacterium]